jgi:3-oxoadipate enol-lactonase
MSAIVDNGRLLHYEAIGYGPPVLFLHSWLGSWRVWMPTMEAISDRYRAIALDFWGFGDSVGYDGPISIDGYVEQVLGFIEALSIQAPHLVGHGLGGVVALRAASVAPERFSRIITSGTPIVGALLRRSIHPQGLTRLLSRDPVSALWKRLVQEAAAGDAAFDDVLADIEATGPRTLEAVVEAISAVDLRAVLARITHPVLAIYGARDRILGLEHAAFFSRATHPERQVVTFDRSGHFPFLDQPAQFNRALLDFLGNQPVAPKQMWKRRVSRREFF